MDPILLVDFGSTFTKLTAVDRQREQIIGTAQAFTTSETDIGIGFCRGLQRLREKTGLGACQQTLACSSAAGGLRMVAVGLVPALTAQAAQMTALSAGAKVVKVYSYHLTDEDVIEIDRLRPDILLLTGGTDGGNTDILLFNAAAISRLKTDVPIVVAGNRSVNEQAAAKLRKTKETVVVCPNVMPQLNILNMDQARDTIRQVFLQRIIQAKGLADIAYLQGGVVMPTPSAVLQAAVLLAKGSGSERGIGEALVVDVGGATTDIYSMADGAPSRSNTVVKGLAEPYAKRTVEGDLGIRYSASSVAQEVGVSWLAQTAGVAQDEVRHYIERIMWQPAFLSDRGNDPAVLDDALAAGALRVAVRRHAGHMETHYTPLGPSYVQKGKDLTGVATIVGTGGPIVHSKYPQRILQHALHRLDEPEVLRPAAARFLVDRMYIMAAMGLLSNEYPETALRILKRELVAVHHNENSE